MAGYRPKSLNELNEMYDKTITAEKAILKASKILEAETQKPAVSANEKTDENPQDSTLGVTSLSDEVDSLINRFNTESTKIQHSKPAFQIEAPEKISYEKAPHTSHTSPPSPPSTEKRIVDEVFAQPTIESPVATETKSEETKVEEPKSKAVYSLEVPEATKEKAMAKSDERTELFDDYMKIMNDDEDDFFAKHEPFGKKKKKKKKIGLFFRHSAVKEDEPDEDEDSLFEDAFTPIEESTEESSNEPPVISFIPDVPAFEQASDETDEMSEADTLPVSDFFPIQESTDDTTQSESENEVSEDIVSESEEDKTSEFEEELNSSDKADDPVAMPQELVNRTYDDYINESDKDIYSYDRTKANTLPSYAQHELVDESDSNEEEEYTYEDYDDFEVEKFERAARKKHAGLLFGRIVLSILLVILSLSSVFTVFANVVLGVDTGKLFGEDKYIFTADRDYINADILEGDLIITEKRFADNGEVFAYVNYTEQCFMFGKMNGSIINDDGDVLFIAENNGERVLVLRDDTKGVVLSTYPGIGKLMQICTENFIVVISALLISCLVIVLLLALVLKDKEKAQQKMIKKMVKKGIIPDEQTAENLMYEEEPDSDDLFSTIE